MSDNYFKDKRAIKDKYLKGEITKTEMIEQIKELDEEIKQIGERDYF